MSVCPGERMAFAGLIAWATVFAAVPAVGQATEGGFSVSKLTVRAFVNPDASVGLLCDATIHNRRGSPALSVLRIPTPSKRFQLGAVRAALDGAAIDDVRLPLEGDPGLEVWLGRHAIPAGGRGRLHLEYTLADEIQPAGDLNASLAIAPPRFVGQSDAPTNLTVTVVLQPGVSATEAERDPKSESSADTFGGRPAISWRRPKASGGEQSFSITFPRAGMTRVASPTMFSTASGWLEATPWLRAVLAAVSVAIFGLAFFRITGGRRWIVFLVVGGTLGALLLRSPGAELMLLPVMIVAAAVVEWRLRRKSVGPNARPTSDNNPDEVEYVVVPERVTISSRVFDQGDVVVDEEEEDEDEDADVAIEVDDLPGETAEPPIDEQPLTDPPPGDGPRMAPLREDE